MKQIFKLVLMVGMLLGWGIQGALAQTAANGTTQAGEGLKKAYQAVVEAEVARSQHQDAEAVKSYRLALTYFEQIKKENPGWQAAMVSNRVVECQNAVAALEMPREPELANKKPVESTLAVSNTVARMQGLLKELRDAQSALMLVKFSSDEAQLKPLEADVERLKDELNEAAKDNQVLQRKVAKLEAKLIKAGVKPGSMTNSACRAVVSAVKLEANRLLNANDPVPAMALLREAIELMPTEGDLVVLLAVANCRDGRFDEAVKLMIPFDVWRGKNADALLTLGMAYMGLGETGKARDAMEKSLSIKPDSAEAHYNLAQILITITPPDIDAAQEHYQRAVELGLPVDLDFENALRTAMIITKMKKHAVTEKRQTTRAVKSEVRNPGAKTDTP